MNILIDPKDYWDTGLKSKWRLKLPEQAIGSKVLSINIFSNKASMLIINVDLKCHDDVNLYRFPILIEWTGWQIVNLLASSFKKIGNPLSIDRICDISLNADSYTLPGTILEIGEVKWLDEMPLIKVNEDEYFLEDFQSPLFWDKSDWKEVYNSGLPQKEYELMVEWSYLKLWYLEKPERFHGAAFAKEFDTDISGFQAFELFTSIDIRACFSLTLNIDGKDIKAVNKRKGIGEGEELKFPINGSKLKRITIEITEAEEMAGKNPNQQASVIVGWFMLERKGAIPSKWSEIDGIEKIENPKTLTEDKAKNLPLSILFNKDKLKEMSDNIKHGAGKKHYKDLLVAANEHLNYSPEPYVGRYLPVNMMSISFNRVDVPGDQLYHYITTMIYCSLAYSLSGDIRYAYAARRVLLATCNIKNWSTGVITRIPVGIVGYRYPMVDSHLTEAVVLCYDMIYSILSEDEREFVEESVYNKVYGYTDYILRTRGDDYLLTSNQGPIYFLGFLYSALICRKRHPEIQYALERNITWFHRMLKQYFRSDGSINEGPAYWVYGTTSLFTAIHILSDISGTDIMDMVPQSLLNSMDYLIQMRSLANEDLDFLRIGDGSGGGMHIYMGANVLFMADRFKDRNALWLWNEYFKKRDIPLYLGRYSGQFSTAGIITLLCLKDQEADKPYIPEYKRFDSCDRILLRTGATYGDKLLLFEGGPQTFEHSHIDKGQVIIEAFGEKLITDPGMIDYNDPASRALGCTAMHNVATIKGRNQSYKDKNKAVITKSVINNSDYTYISADISHSYSEFARYDRRILFVRPDYFLIYDDIISDEEGIEWNLHSIGNFSTNTGGFEINSDKAGMLTSVYSNGSLAYKISDFRRGCMLSYNPYEKKLIDEYIKTTSNPMRVCSNLIIAASDGRKDFKLAALLVPYSNIGSATKPTVMSQEVPGGVVFTVSGLWGTDRLVCRTGNEAALYENEILTDRIAVFRGTSKFLISDVEDKN